MSVADFETSTTALLTSFADLRFASPGSIDINSGPRENPLQCESEEPLGAGYVWRFNAN